MSLMNFILGTFWVRATEYWALKRAWVGIVALEVIHGINYTRRSNQQSQGEVVSSDFQREGRALGQ